MRTKSARHRPDRGQLRQVMADLIEGVVLIEPDGSIAWANAAALAMHGCERLDQLGRNVRAYRKRFVLRSRDDRRIAARLHPIARLAAGDSFVDVEVTMTRRDGVGLHRALMLRGMTLSDRGGSLETLVLMIKDVTERFEAEERFERAFAVNPAPGLILRIADSRYVKVNEGFLEMTGYARDEVIGLPLRELDVLGDAEHRKEAITALRNRDNIPQQESRVPTKAGGRKFVIVAGETLEIDDEDCMLFTFIDLDARKRAEDSLRQSEERFAKAFRLAPVPMLVCARRDLRIIEVNDAFMAVTGHAYPDIVGQRVADIWLFPDSRLLRELRSALDAGSNIRHRELQMLTRERAEVDCVLSAETITIQDEPCILCVVQDITERKRSEADLVAAIEAVMQDTSWFSHTVMEKLAQLRHPGRLDEGLNALTQREREVLELICRGQTNAEIAAALGLSGNTVRNYIANLYEKLGVNRRSAAVVWGRERGLPTY